jgi:hypothetical protein
MKPHHNRTNSNNSLPTSRKERTSNRSIQHPPGLEIVQNIDQQTKVFNDFQKSDNPLFNQLPSGPITMTSSANQVSSSSQMVAIGSPNPTALILPITPPSSITHTVFIDIDNCGNLFTIPITILPFLQILLYIYLVVLIYLKFL